MRKLITVSVAGSLLLFFAISCKKELKQESAVAVSQEVKNKVSALGFSTQNIAVHENGYLVEGDIIITEEELKAVPEAKFLRVGETEQYRTYNLVTGLPRVIRVAVSSRLSSSYVSAVDVALSRYNALGLRITFQRVTSNPNITITRGNGNYLASAGFPSSGQPYSQVLVNTNQLSGQPQATVASVIAHELGHCIGFRHTDYMSRQYSCGGQAVNEGASSYGAVLVPGTPSGPDPNSWMLACINSGGNRPFNANDITALNYLY